MWLHVPLPTSVYAQESQDLRLDSKQLSLLEQYATWKTKSASQRYWQNVWKNNHSLMKHLYGLICEPSTLILGVEEWISSQVASLVSRSQSPDTDSKKTTPEIYGLTQPDLYGGLGHQLSFSKMFQESSNIISIQSDPNFVRWVTRLRKDYSQRQRQAHRTSDREFSSWPTPTVWTNSTRQPSSNHGTSRPGEDDEISAERQYRFESGFPLFPPGPSERKEWDALVKRYPDIDPTVCTEGHLLTEMSSTESELCRASNGTPNRMDSRIRLRAIGNAVVPAVAANAFRILSKTLSSK